MSCGSVHYRVAFVVLAAMVLSFAPAAGADAPASTVTFASPAAAVSSIASASSAAATSSAAPTSSAQSDSRGPDVLQHYRLKRHAYRLRLEGNALTRVVCSVGMEDGTSDTVTWDPEERRGPVRYALLPQSFSESKAAVCAAMADICSPTASAPACGSVRRACDAPERSAADVHESCMSMHKVCEDQTSNSCRIVLQHCSVPAPHVACRAEPLLLSSEAGSTVISYATDFTDKYEDLELEGTVVSDSSGYPSGPPPIKISVSIVRGAEKEGVLSRATGLENSTRLRSLDPTTRIVGDALTALATVALDRAKSAGKQYVREIVRENLCENLTVESVRDQLTGSTFSDAVDQLPWDEKQPLLKNTCRLLNSLNIDELISSPDVLWKSLGVDIAMLSTEIILNKLSKNAGQAEAGLRQVLAAAQALLISSLVDGATTTERDAQLLILQLGTLGFSKEFDWSTGLEIGIAILQECLRNGACTADVLKQSFEREVKVAEKEYLLQSWPELPALLGRAADVLQPPPGTTSRVTAANALALALDVTDKALAFAVPLCAGNDGLKEATWKDSSWLCEAPGLLFVSPRDGRHDALCVPSIVAQGTPNSDYEVDNATCSNASDVLVHLEFLRGDDSPFKASQGRELLDSQKRLKQTRDVMASLRGLVHALQDGDVATAASGLAQTIANCVSEHCEGNEQCDKANWTGLGKSFRIVTALATYGASYRTGSDDVTSAEVEKARADERKKAVESLIDAATDRTDREGDWVWSLGTNVGLGYDRLWRNGREDVNPLSLRTGLSIQRLSASFVPGHLMFTLLDLAQYALLVEESTGEGEETELKTPKAEVSTALQLGAELGWVFGKPSNPILLAIHAGWAPRVSIGGEAKSETVVGVSAGVFVPFIDFN